MASPFFCLQNSLFLASAFQVHIWSISVVFLLTEFYHIPPQYPTGLPPLNHHSIASGDKRIINPFYIASLLYSLQAQNVECIISSNNLYFSSWCLILHTSLCLQGSEHFLEDFPFKRVTMILMSLWERVHVALSYRTMLWMSI